ncbi:phage holin family protein [Actinocatenispora comari]|jgi:predicted lipid-binding transport protein (Tim44 family)|uniref:Phage holin family protein n=1 Tax=Actinocatenispora comari TaxID=2807577 RepID=A0A8J4EJI7_9ACTN|nr:phage holin family protein [Actinocatenispora comari]GIL26080.1 hypothetical protein NUM_13340 [Actinocatenispora comari]
MTVTQPQAEPVHRAGDPDEDRPIGAILTDIKGDVGRLVGEQLAIAKAEMKQEGIKAGIGGGLIAAALLGGFMMLLFASLAAVYGLGHLLGNGWAALIVAGAWLLFALLTGLIAKSVLGRLNGPQLTIATLKENLEWARSLKK